MIRAAVGVASLWLATAAAAGPARGVPERVGDRFAVATWGGRLLTEPVFDALTPSRDGRAAAQVDGRWGIVDARGRWVVAPHYDWVDPALFDGGPALVSLGGRFGYVSREGREVLPPILEEASPFVGGFACVRDPQAMASGLIDGEGLPVSGFRFESCDAEFRDGLARVRAAGRWGYVDRAGELRLPAIYDRAEPFSEGLALVEEGGLRAYVDPTGERVAPASAEDAGPFVEGRARIRRGPDQVGFIDGTGRTVVATRWRRAQDFSEGLAWVLDPATARWAAIDRDGAVVLTSMYEDPTPFRDGAARVARDGRYGVIDRRGRELVPIRYAAVGDVAEGLVAVAAEPGGPVGVVDLSGDEVHPPLYDSIGPFRDGLALAVRCRWEPARASGPETRRCDEVYLDARGRERARRPRRGLTSRSR